MQIFEEAQQEVPMDEYTRIYRGAGSTPVGPGHVYEDNTLLSDILPGSCGASNSQAVVGSSTVGKRDEKFGDAE